MTALVWLAVAIVGFIVGATLAGLVHWWVQR